MTKGGIMKKRIFLLLIITLALTVAQNECSGNTETGPVNTNPFIGGTRGLSIQFSEGAPPDEVFDGDTYPFDIEVKLENVGETKVNKENVLIRISGINPEDFGKSQSDFIMDGISEDIFPTIIDSEGNQIDAPPVFVSFRGLIYKDTLAGNNQFPVRADVCYRYETTSFADGCVRANLLTDDKDAVCQVHEEKNVFNSGSPLQIAEFLEQPSGSNKIRYIFKIKHKGSGRFYLPQSKCPVDIENSRINEDRVHFRIESNVDDLQCSGLRDTTGKEGNVLLVNGEATIHCTQQSSSNLDFIDKIKIHLSYDYKESVDKILLVKKTIN